MPVFGDQLVVRTRFDDSAAVENQDAVAGGRLPQPVCYQFVVEHPEVVIGQVFLDENELVTGELTGVVGMAMMLA